MAIERYPILDAGPLVALLSERDTFHVWAVEQLSGVAAFLTCEAVISEAMFLLKRPEQVERLLRFVQAAPVLFPTTFESHSTHIIELILQYSNVPMSFADACLVQLSELYPDAPILTLDSDFLIYRRNRNEHLPVILPPGRKQGKKKV